MKRTMWYTLLCLGLALCVSGCGTQSDNSTASGTSGGDPNTAASSAVSDTTSSDDDASDSAASDDTTALALSAIATTEMGATLDEDDQTDAYAAFDATITLSDGASRVSGNSDAVTIDGDTITIAAGGTYALSGSLSNGQILVSGGEKVRLYLDGVSVTCATSPALVCVSEKRTILTLAPNSENQLSDASGYTSYTLSGQEIDPSAVYVQDKLTVNGSGTLSISGNNQDGLVCKDDLKLVAGAITVNAVHNGVKGKDCVAVYDDVRLSITAGHDGIKSTETDDPAQGFVQIDGGEIAVQAGGDAIQAETLVRIAGGSLTLSSDGTATDDTGAASSARGIHCTAYVELLVGTVTINTPGDGIHCGGSCTIVDGDYTIISGEDGIQAELDLIQSGGQVDITTTGEVATATDEGFGFGGQAPGDFGDMASPDNVSTLTQITETTETTDTTDDASSKGLKVGGTLTLSGGSCTITATDHAVHGAGDGVLSGTNLTLSSNNKGISVHGNLTISGGDIIVQQATEGIESKLEMQISGGNIQILAASDDGLNTGGTTSDSHALTISGGYVYVCADGDGIDSNSTLDISGGTVLVCGPTSGADGSIDFETTMTYTGGTLLALSSRGMMEYADSGLLVTTGAGASAGDLISVVDGKGNVLVALESPKAVSDIIYGIGDSDASGYTIYTDGTYSGTLNENGYGTGGTLSGGTAVEIAVSGGMMGGFGGGFGGKMQAPDPSADGDMTPPELPEGQTPAQPESGDMTPPELPAGQTPGQTPPQ